MDNGIDAGDPASFDAWMGGHARGSMDGGWEYAGRQAAQQWRVEAEEEARMMAKEQAIETARGRLQREQPQLSRGENIRLAEAEAETTWRNYIDDFRAECGIDDSESGSEVGEAEQAEHGVGEDMTREQLGNAARQQAQFVQRDRAAEKSSAQHWPLNESELDYAAETRGWEKIECERSEAPMASYKKDEVRLNFWLSTGTVGSYLDHPTQGKTQLFRRDITMSAVAALFANPRQHTGAGYHTREQLHGKRPASPNAPKTPAKRGSDECLCLICGDNAAKACANVCCGKCCPGPCARHAR